MPQSPHDDFDFSALSLKDLIEARDVYHFHLMRMANVIGTAVGLYLIRNDEAWPQAKGESVRPRQKLTYPRTFNNSQVRDYSWPCIIVVVRDWVMEDEFGQAGQPAPTDFVPKRLYLSDGRAVPVCVVLAAPIPKEALPPPAPVAWPRATFGGGLPLHVDVQHEERVATVGCLVSDGHATYALTARHVCGEPGTEITGRLRSGPFAVGTSSPHQITRQLFGDVYPALQLRQTWLNLDVGLIRLDDIRDWTPNTYGLPPIKPLYDIYEQNLSLRALVDQPVVAVGAASGLLTGHIKAMFYRFRSVGGYDYVSDFLMSPSHETGGARPGDSGALWYLQMPGPDGKEDTRPLSERDLRPLAIVWGSQTFAQGAERSRFSVATSLSNVCKLLDVELVIDDSDGVSGIWGAVGHYSIGTLAIDLVKDKTLKAFLTANSALISLPLDQLTSQPKEKALIDSDFVALADVPDIVWKKYPAPHLTKKGDDIGVVGGRDDRSSGFSSSGPEHANHHCDADAEWPSKPGQNLRQVCLADPTQITAANWNAYFDSFPKKVDDIHRGILPFRVWQFFERLKDYAATDPARFIAAAGTLAHYVGDASQPLHGSTLADGDPNAAPDIPRNSPSRKDKQGNKLPAFRGEGVHSAYETDMVNWAAHQGLLFDEIRKNLGDDHGMSLIKTGRDAAVASIQLMEDAASRLSPTMLIDGYETTFAPGAEPRAKALWTLFSAQTGEVMALGAQTLAMIWDSAWKAGKGKTNAGELAPADVKSHYTNTNFVRSVTVDYIETEITHPTDDS
jgi:hypothetical protein